MEDESNEIPVADPKPPGMNSFLDMNDDDGDGDDGNKHASEKPDKSRVKGLPPYDTSTPSNVNFSSEIIGTTVRRGAFLSVPGELEDCSSESSESSSPSEVDFSCSPYDGIATSDSEVDFCCSPYDGIVTTTPTSSSSTRRQGMGDMAYFAENLKDRIAEEGFNLVPTISRRTGLLDLSKFAEMDPTMSWGSLDQLRALDEEPMVSGCDISVHDGCEGHGDSSSDIEPVAVPHGIFLSVPGVQEEELSENMSSDSGVDVLSSPHDGIATIDSVLDFYFSSPPYDGPTGSNCDIGHVAAPHTTFLSVSGELELSESLPSDSEVDFPGSPYDGVATIGSVLDFYSSCSPEDQLSISNDNVGPVAAHRGAFLLVPGELKDDSSESFPSESEMDFPCPPYNGITTIDSALDFYFSSSPHDQSTISNGDIDAVAASHVGLDLMRRLLAELRDPNLDCNPRSLSEDSESEYDDEEEEEEEEANIPRLTSTSVLYNARQNSLESISTYGTDSGVSDEGPIYPLTPPSKPSTALPSAPGVRMDCMSPAVVPRFNGEVLTMSPTSWDSPPSFPTKAYVRSHRDNYLYGPRVPLLNLPRL